MKRLTLLLFSAMLSCTAAPAVAQTRLKDFCRIKGQEENTLQGLGIVVGLKGSGDGSNFLPTIRSLAKAMTVMGEPTGQKGLAELKDAKNVALVAVTVTIPAAGARQGDKLDCAVNSIGSAKSLAGGRLFLTALIGPDRSNPRVFGFAEGQISLADPAMTTNGRVFQGCRLEEDFFNVFTKDGRITLVLDRNHADFQVAQDVADVVNGQMAFQSAGSPLAKAVNQVNVEVLIPPQYRNDPVMFVSQVLALPMLEPQTGSKVVINERAGSIVISGNVEIGAVTVTHKNITIDTAGGAPGDTTGGGAAGGATPASRFVPVDPSGKSTARLKSLVETLNAIHAPTQDIIEIIKGLDRNGKLHAPLIIE